MIGLLTITVVSTAASTWLQKKKKSNKQLSHYLVSQAPKQTLMDKFHAVVEDKCDRLLKDNRSQHLKKLNGSFADLVISDEAKRDNGYLAVTAINATTAVLLGLLAPAWLMLTVPVSLYLVRRPFQMAWQGLRHERRINVSLVDSVAVTIAILTGFWQITAVSLFLYAIAMKLLNKVKHTSKQQLTGLFGYTPTMVWVLHEGVETETKLEHLQTDDVVMVHAGEMIPVDGIILHGSALIDQRILTGESQPSEKQVGDEVFASTLLLSGCVQLKVQRAGACTVAARIGSILEKTSEYKNQHESHAEAATNRTAAPTLLLSILAFPISGISGTIGVLWSSMGYNMRITSPMSVMNFLRAASEQQILIKDSSVLDQLSNIDTVVFDKTGTLTEETPEVCQIYVFAKMSEAELLACAAALEHRQTHPIARAILEAAHNQSLKLPEIEARHCKLGYGIEANVDGQSVYLGSCRFMEHSGIEIFETSYRIQENAEINGHSLVMLGIDGVLVGAIELRPQLRSSAGAVIHALKQRGIHTCIISGDRETPTRSLSQQLGIDQYFANTLPEQKSEIVKQLQAEGRKVCFIGDGINDAIALKQADVSVSLCGATAVATDTAQIILMDADLSHLVNLLEMGKQFQQSQAQNLRLSVIPAAASIVSIFVLHAGLTLAAVMFYSGMALGVRNAIRPVRFQRLSDIKPVQSSSHSKSEATTQLALPTNLSNDRTDGY